MRLFLSRRSASLSETLGSPSSSRLLAARTGLLTCRRRMLSMTIANSFPLDAPEYRSLCETPPHECVIEDHGTYVCPVGYHGTHDDVVLHTVAP